MGMGKVRLPQCSNVHWFSVGMAKSSQEVEERARGKTISGEMCSTPAVHLRGPGGTNTCPVSLSHAFIWVVHLQVFMGLPQRSLERNHSTAPMAASLLEGVLALHPPKPHTPGWVLCSCGLPFSSTMLTSTCTVQSL